MALLPTTRFKENSYKPLQHANEVLMITREDLRQLADFECRANEYAISFYFQPGVPKDKSHREEGIQAKELVRKTIQELQQNGRSAKAIQDLERILRIAEALHGNEGFAKVVFSCAERNLWREFDVPPVQLSTRLFVNRRFHLKPLAALFSEYPKLWVALVDRQSARVLEVEFGEIRQQMSITNPIPRHGRSDGFGGYDGGHAQRHKEDEVRRHYRELAEFLKNGDQRRLFDAVVLGCNDVNWPELQAQLHPDVAKKTLGHFSGEIAAMPDERAVSEALRVAQATLRKHHSSLLGETLDEARAHRRGVTGLRRVLRALELGEIDTLLMSQDYSARAVECTNCRHLDSHLVAYCPVCGHATRELEDVCEVLVPIAVRNNLGLVLLPRDETIDKVGNIAALLRFRADRNTNQLRAAS
jgi:peptide subunit release factor 1 (eRF1)